MQEAGSSGGYPSYQRDLNPLRRGRGPGRAAQPEWAGRRRGSGRRSLVQARPVLPEPASVSLNAKGCAPAREPGAGSTIPSLPLRRLLLARPERELRTPGSPATSFCFPLRAPPSGGSARRVARQRARTGIAPPTPPPASILGALRSRARGGKGRNASFPAAWLRPGPRWERRHCGAHTCKLALEVPGCGRAPLPLP